MKKRLDQFKLDSDSSTHSERIDLLLKNNDSEDVHIELREETIQLIDDCSGGFSTTGVLYDKLILLYDKFER